MDSKELGKITAELQNKHPDVGIQKIELDETSGKASFFIKPTNKMLASLPPDQAYRLRPIETASTLRRDVLSRTNLDLISTSPYEMDSTDIFKNSFQYYYEEDIYGSHIDILSNLASKGFENDISDHKVKAFYDTWCFDVNFRQILDWIFLDFFRVGMVRTYKIIGKYNPGVSYLSPIPGQSLERGIIKQVIERAERIQKKREDRAADGLNGKKARAAKKKIWSKGYVPLAYTVLNPLSITIEGSLLFDKTKITLKTSDELKDMLKKNMSELTADEVTIVKSLPSDFKSQAEEGSIELDPMYVGSVDYRKMPYERYPKPRGIKAFEAIEYKKALRKADLSTLDGISNYILKITIGSDEFPVTDQSQLETVAKLFDTPSKAFDVVWNHTLKIERIVSPDIEHILGKEKYGQVNDDITGALAFSRSMIDGSTNLNTAEVGLLTKTIIEEINYARRQVERWIYGEYRHIANAMGFKQFPKVRWDNTVLRDIILYMSTISQLVDRRMLSYRTALEQLGFDFESEFGNMKEELKDVLEGTLGIVGSPFQRAKTGLQPVQNSPEGTPSSGRPSGQPAKTKEPDTNPDNKTKVPNQAPSNQPSTQKSSITISDVVRDMSDEEFGMFINKLVKLRK